MKPGNVLGILPLWQLAVAVVVALLLLALPPFAGTYHTQLFTYGLVFAIAALGFNLLLGTTVAAALGLWAFVYRTKFGVLLRATSQDMRMASALGLNVRRVYAQAFAIGCFMAGLGGAIVVPSQAAVLGMGIDVLILAFVVVVIGGLGSLKGALLGALIVGFVRTGVIQFYEELELAVLYLIATLVLLVRPTGIFGKTS